MSTNISVVAPSILAGRYPYNSFYDGTYVKSPNPGFGDRFYFTGTSLLMNVNVSGLSGQGYAAGIYPVIAKTVDGVRTTYQLLSTDTSVTIATGLADATHSCQIRLIGVDESGVSDRWTNAYMSLIIGPNYVVDTGKTILPWTPVNGGWMITYGDSIMEGALALSAATNPPTYAQAEDATKSYAELIANTYGLNLGFAAFAGQSWSIVPPESNSPVSNVPGLNASYNFIWNGVSRVFTPAPNLALINMGTNGTVVKATVTTFLTNLRAAVGPNCFINLMIPLIGWNLVAITDGYNDYRTANPTDSRVTLIDCGAPGVALVSNPLYSYDGLHLTTAGHIAAFALIIPNIKLPFIAGNPNSSIAAL